MTAEELLPRLQRVRPCRDGWTALCPAHNDHNPSLSVHQRDGLILLHCHAGCPVESILAVLDLTLADLFEHNRNGPRIVATYRYTDEAGALLYQTVRLDPKDFRQRRPDGNGGWIWNLDGIRRVLYRLPEVLAASDFLICEGEKDCETARTLGLVATTNPGGAGKWRDEYAAHLRAKRVVIIADVDVPGRKYAQQVAASLHGKADSLKVIELPSAKDLSEWVERGGKRETLLELIRNAPEWKPQTVEGGAVLDALVAYIRRFVFLSESQARVVALWVVHTHAFATADATPYLAVTSPEKRSGKTLLLEVLDILVAHPWMTGRVTAAVLIRKVDAEQPTLLLDESDAAFRGEKEYAEALRGVLNTGHRRGGKASCCVGQGANISYRDFSTFCPKAIAGIGKLPDTVDDRAIPVRLKRAAPGEVAERFRRRDVEAEAAQLRGQVEAWCTAIAPKLRGARPELPQQLTDRQLDGAEPLLAIADLAGGTWPELARRALVELCAQAQTADDSIGTRLLADIYAVFEEKGADRLPSEELVFALAKLETSPWAESAKGKPITPSQLAKLLKPYDISPDTVRIGSKTPRGYRRDDFHDAWRRYLPRAGPEGATTQQANKNAASSDFQGATPGSDVAAPNDSKSSEMNGVAAVVPQCSLFEEGEL